MEASGEKAAAYFYGRLFAAEPRVRALFPPAMDVQRDRLFQALTTIVFRLDDPDSLLPYLRRLGRDHRKYGVRPEHYPAVGAALLATLRKFAGPAWSAEAETAWTAAYRTASTLMIEAAEQDADTPPWWVAEVTAHDRRAHDLAVLTLRPGQPVPFTPGQYVTVQCARWPRVWRPFSVANAPRADGSLELHVRAVPGGWVSGALVRSTAPGDTVLLGPPLGTMTLDPGSDRDLVLVAGGTGLAPLKAVLEQVATTAPHRAVHLVVGARDERGLYDLPGLRALTEACPGLRIVPVLSDAYGEHPYRAGLLPDVLPEVLRGLPDLDEHEAFVCGPADMTRTAVDALRRLGVPSARIHHDLAETGEPVVPELPPARGCPVVHHA
ncbi:globin domain-containing protein [Actinomadura flavalba]|uniref:globin domain-containing protein n=1 Tax=Actinomadura flavalba TaxID=1120938 RepID=UPI00036B6008